jgi:hypothetical protein
MRRGSEASAGAKVRIALRQQDHAARPKSHHAGHPSRSPGTKAGIENAACVVLNILTNEFSDNAAACQRICFLPRAADPWVRHRGFVQYADEPEPGAVPYIRTPIKIGDAIRVRTTALPRSIVLRGSAAVRHPSAGLSGFQPRRLPELIGSPTI